MHVVVLGAGYAGLTAVRRLERSLPGDVDLTLVDEDDAHLVQHELHRVLRRPELEEAVSVPLDSMLDRARIRTSRVEAVDPAARTVRLADGEPLAYDYAAVCLGASTDFHDLPGVEAHATPFKRLAHADRIRSRLFAEEGGRVVVGGAGLSGVQVAGELAATVAEEEFDAEIVLLERFDRVAPGFATAFQRAIREELVALDVDVRTEVTVAGADGTAVALEGGESLAYDQFVWTGGIAGPAALAGERRATPADLRIADGTFVAGDAAWVVDAHGEAVPATAQAAIGQGRVVAANVTRLVEHDRAGGDGFRPRLDRFSFDSSGWVVSVGDHAVAQVGPTVLRGRAARVAKASASANYLSRVGTLSNAAAVVRDEL